MWAWLLILTFQIPHSLDGSKVAAPPKISLLTKSTIKESQPPQRSRETTQGSTRSFRLRSLKLASRSASPVLRTIGTWMQHLSVDAIITMSCALSSKNPHLLSAATILTLSTKKIMAPRSQELSMTLTRPRLQRKWMMEAHSSCKSRNSRARIAHAWTTLPITKSWNRDQGWTCPHTGTPPADSN